MGAENLDLEDRCEHPVVERIVHLEGISTTYTVYHCIQFYGGCNKIWRDINEDPDNGIDPEVRHYVRMRVDDKFRHLFMSKTFEQKPVLRIET